MSANNSLNEDVAGTWLELKGQFLEAIEGNMNACDATSVVSKLVYDMCTGDKLFKAMCCYFRYITGDYKIVYFTNCYTTGLFYST